EEVLCGLVARRVARAVANVDALRRLLHGTDDLRVAVPHDAGAQGSSVKHRAAVGKRELDPTTTDHIRRMTLAWSEHRRQQWSTGHQASCSGPERRARRRAVASTSIRSGSSITTPYTSAAPPPSTKPPPPPFTTPSAPPPPPP